MYIKQIGDVDPHCHYIIYLTDVVCQPDIGLIQFRNWWAIPIFKKVELKWNFFELELKFATKEI